MGWSIRLGRVLGIDIRIHLTFFLLLAFIVFSSYTRSGDWGMAMQELVFILLVFAVVVMHEYGHALAARMYGVKTHDITLLPIGGVARLERIPENPWQEFVIAVAGPAVNVVLAALLLAYMVLQNEADQVEVGDPLTKGSVIGRLAMVNVWLVLFNMIPAFPMDGGRVLRSLLAMVTDRAKATQVAAAVGQVVALGMGFLGLMSHHPFLVFIALFVWIGAAQEAADAQQKSSLSGVPVQTAMVTKFQVVSPRDTLAEVARQVLASFQQDFPVVDEGRVVGMITQRSLFEALATDGRDGVVANAMQAEFATATPGEMVAEVIPRLQAASLRSIPVLDGGRIVGLLTTENISELLMIRSALAQAGKA